MRLSRIIFLTLSAILLGLYEPTVAPFLPEPFRWALPVVIVLTVLVTIKKTREALIFAGVAGLMVDLFTTSGGQFAIARFMVIVLVLSAVQSSVLTNRSLYASLALGLVARSLDALWRTSASFLSALLFHAPASFLSGRAFITTIMWDAALISLGFGVVAFFTKRFLILPRASSRTHV